MLRTRILTALVLIPAVLAGLFLLPPLAWALATLALIGVAAYEWARLTGFAAGDREDPRVRFTITFKTGVVGMTLDRQTVYVSTADGVLKLSLRFVGRNDLPLRWWNATLLRTDEWQWQSGRWWVVPGKV